MNKTFTSMEQLPLALNADEISGILGISKSKAYELLHSKDFPSIHLGKRLIVPKDKFIEWMNSESLKNIERI